jgi:hypothetical protein
MQPRNSKMQAEDVFPIFQDAVQTAFQFLITDFKFRLDPISVDDSMAFVSIIGCHVKYRNETTEIKVTYDWYEDLRGTPQVICGRLSFKDGSLDVTEAYNLDMIIADRCPGKAVNTHAEDPVEEITQTLDAYASVLAECARDVLAGDFTIFPRLRKTLASEMKGAVFLHSGVDANELIEHLDKEDS